MHPWAAGCVVASTLIAAIGCGDRRSRDPRAAAPAAVGTDATAAWTDERAMARWREIGPTAETWPFAIADAEARPLALALLRAGGAECTAFEVRSECGHRAEHWSPLPAGAGIDDPCLRRSMLAWALTKLAPDDARALLPLLRALVAAPPRDDELADAAFAAAPDDPTRLVLLEAVLAADDEPEVDYEGYVEDDADYDDRDRAEAWAEKLTTDAARLAAYQRLALVAPVAAIDPVAHRSDLVAIVADPDAQPSARVAALARLGAASGDDLRAALVAASQAESCELAAAAAEALAERGDPSRLPSRPRSRDVEVHLHALCVLSYSVVDDAETRWRAWLPPRVETVSIGQHYIDEMPGVAWGDPDRERVAAKDVELPEELRDEDWQCQGTSCSYSGHPYDVRIDFAARGDSLVIRRIERRSYAGDDC